MKRSLRRIRRRLYLWSRHAATSRAGGWGVGTASFAEATVVPIPLEALLAPLMFVHQDRAWRLALIATAGFVAAASVGYCVGWLFFETLGNWIVAHFEWQTDFALAQNWIETYGFWAVFAIGVTPVPFQIAMLLAGFSGMPFLLFLMAAGFSRGIRYFGLAGVILWIGSTRDRSSKESYLSRLGSQS